MAYAESVADLVVAAFSGRPAPAGAIGDLDAYRRTRGRAARPGDEIARQIYGVVARWSPPLRLVSAWTVPHRQAADVRLEFVGGQPGWIQIKAQLTKDRFADLTQADWDQDFTAGLAQLAKDDPTFDALLTPAYRARLSTVPVLTGWTLSDLVIADIFGLPDGARARAAGVTTVADLHRFLPHSYLLQITREGTRLVPHRDFTCIRAYLAGRQFHHRNLGAGTGALAKVWCSWGIPPLARNQVHWQYYAYDRIYGTQQVWGRHKLNRTGVGAPPGAIVVPARP